MFQGVHLEYKARVRNYEIQYDGMVRLTSVVLVAVTDVRGGGAPRGLYGLPVRVFDNMSSRRSV